MALAIFAISLPAFIEAGAFAIKIQHRAEATLLGSELAQTAMMRLASVDAFDPLLLDPIPDNFDCFTVSGSCAADHGNNLAELNKVFNGWGSTSPYTIAIEDGFAAVWYEGYWFHVAWNVENNEPYNGMKTIVIFVNQQPFDGPIATTWIRTNKQHLVRMMTAL